ncbi:germacrene-A synthase-like [Humulus lupulus]|uniref:germacrene-A synthase-like n=1 Tax=Humulus lupulus TaxID=3486 RepID=UPI002B400945|nr:germacrene-A synthase-like [Humulus lupulus]
MLFVHQATTLMMSTPILASSSQNGKTHKIVRPTKTFQPHIWGERLVRYTISEQELCNKEERVQELKAEVGKDIFGESTYDVSNQLKLIDVVGCLGLSYHFESEIENELECIYNQSIDQNYLFKDEDLHDASIRFRLLRQHGFKVSSDIFEKFKDKDGNFEKCLATDTLGLLSLYEAAHLSCVGEHILDEALAFATRHLTEFLANKKEHDDLLSKEISRALERPLRKSLEKLHARHFISIYEKEASHNKALLQLAKLDFNLLQSMHKKELSEIVRWWKELDFVHKFPFARDRIVELYLWVLGINYEPQYPLARNILTKILALCSIADDIYDEYGTFEELELLSEAIERWDISFMDKLNQEYLKTFYKVLLNFCEEFEQELTKEETYRVYYAKEAFKELVRAFLDEARWLKEGRVPSFEEYLKFSMNNYGGYFKLIVSSLVGTKTNIVTKEVFEWLSKNPKIVRASITISRLMDDIAEHKFEQVKCDELSAVECYMKQYGVSKEEAYDELNKRVVNAWKEINEEFLKPTDVASPILVHVLNFSRVVDLLYKYGDGYTQVGKVTKDTVAALLIDPIP